MPHQPLASKAVIRLRESAYAGPGAVLLLVVALVLGMDAYGRSSRSYAEGHTVYHVESPQEAVAVWRTLGLRGRVLVNVDEYLTVDLEYEWLPPVMEALDREDTTLPVEATSVVGVSMYSSIARKVFHVVPDADWPRVSSGLASRPELAKEHGGYRLVVDGVPIIVTRARDLPRLAEPVIVYVNDDFAPRIDRAVLDRLTSDPNVADVVVRVGGEG